MRIIKALLKQICRPPDMLRNSRARALRELLAKTEVPSGR